MGTSDPNIGVGYMVAGASFFVLRKLFRKFDFRTPDFRVLAGVDGGYMDHTWTIHGGYIAIYVRNDVLHTICE